MRERIEALAPGSGVWVGTFHSLCARLLRTYAPLVGLDRGFTIYDQADRLRAVKQAMERLDLDERLGHPRADRRRHQPGQERPGHPRGCCAKRGRRPRRRPSPPRSTAPTRSGSATSSAVDFDDLLVHIVTILKEHTDVRADLDARFRYVLVDEYQDTNLAQYAIVRALSVDHPNLCVTGDPDQSIYGWRGANLSNILEFEHDYPGCQVVKLERNYRSTKNILRVADHLIRHNRRRKPKSLTTENPERPAGRADHLRDRDRRGPRASPRRSSSWSARGSTPIGDIAVFCRVTALTRNFEPAFRAAKIPYQIVGGVSFYERQEVKDVLAYLNLMANPKDDLAFAAGGERPASRGSARRRSTTSPSAARDAGHPAPGDGPAGRGRSPG